VFDNRKIKMVPAVQPVTHECSACGELHSFKCDQRCFKSDDGLCRECHREKVHNEISEFTPWNGYRTDSIGPQIEGDRVEREPRVGPRDKKYPEAAEVARYQEMNRYALATDRGTTTKGFAKPAKPI
jgi:hypothetical protein